MGRVVEQRGYAEARERQNLRDELNMLWHWMGRQDGGCNLQKAFLDAYPYMTERLQPGKAL